MTTRTAVLLTGTAVAALSLTLTACGSSSPRATTPTTGVKVSTSPNLLASGGTNTSSSSAAGPIVTTTGTGTVTGTPDTLTVSIDVSTTGAHAGTALQSNNAISAAVQQTLERDGVAVSDIQTGNLSLQQNYNGSTPSGYAVDDTVTATLHHLANAGTVIDDAINAAGDSGRLDGISLSMSDTNPLMAAARQQAVATARAQAQQLAAAAGARLGGLVSLTDQAEQQPYTGPEFGTAAGASAGASTPVPVQAGSQQLSVEVTAVWALIPASGS